jgi:hypothetical protein
VYDLVDCLPVLQRLDNMLLMYPSKSVKVRKELELPDLILQGEPVDVLLEVQILRPLIFIETVSAEKPVIVIFLDVIVVHCQVL